MSQASALSPLDQKNVIRKVVRRTVPLLFVLYIIAYLDRANAGFAKLQMMEKLKDQGFTNEVFGNGFSIFFWGYLLLEIPGALLVEHWSARKWFTRIMVTWGLCSMGMALVKTPYQFYSARFLLGLAEAGFFPGVIVYLTHWFPKADRARAMAGLVLGIPISMGLGAKVTGELLNLNAFGLDGWQWAFIAEGAPAVLLGCMLPWLLTDRPRQATWLTDAEKDWLEGTLESERKAAAVEGNTTVLMALQQPTVWLLALSIFAVNTGGYALSYWLPTTIKHMLESKGELAGMTDAAQNAKVLNWLLPIYLCGLIGVYICGRSSDYFRERKWHCAACQGIAGLILLCTVIPDQTWFTVIAWFAAFMVFSFAWPPPFWVLPTLTLSASAAAVTIAIINIAANVAGAVGPMIFGMLKEREFKDETCLMLAASCYVVGSMFVMMLRVPKSRPVDSIAPRE